LHVRDLIEIELMGKTRMHFFPLSLPLSTEPKTPPLPKFIFMPFVLLGDFACVGSHSNSSCGAGRKLQFKREEV